MNITFTFLIELKVPPLAIPILATAMGFVEVLIISHIRVSVSLG